MTNRKSSAGFEEAIKKLNNSQRQAVETIDGPVMVIAGPGTGKTQILAVRIANILYQTDTSPDSVLAITFTESGVSAMRSRLQTFIGRIASDVSIYTFHGLANELIRTNSDIFPKLAGAKQLSDIERIDILEKIIQETDLEILKPMGDIFYYLNSISRAIDELKREGLTVELFEKKCKQALEDFNNIDDLYHEKGKYVGQMKGKYQTEEKIIKKNQELLLIYEKYAKTLESKKFYDFSDMIIELKNALEENKNFRLILQERFHYLLIDEHQDTNFAQNRIIELLADFFEEPNLFVVGDEKQAIFRFQGASLQNFYYFKNRFPNAKLISLTDNYRSSQIILDLAWNLFPRSQYLKSGKEFKDQESVKLAIYDNVSHELAGVTRRIAELVKQGAKPSEIAVIYRNNKDALLVSSWLDRLSIPYVIESRQGLFENYYVKQVIELLRFSQNVLDDTVLARIMHFPIFDLEPVIMFKVLQGYYRSRKFPSLFEYLIDEDFFDERLKPFLPRKIILTEKDTGQDLDKNEQILANWNNFILFLKNNLSTYKQMSPSDSLRTMLNDAGVFKAIIVSNSAQTDLEIIEQFINEAENIFNADGNRKLADLLLFIDLAEKHRLGIGEKNKRTGGEKVRLLTAHGSKGLEFEYVFVILADDKHFGSSKRAELLPLIPSVYELIKINDQVDSDVFDDERRLFYVALTRAKNYLWISYSNKNTEGKEQSPSPFVAELDQNLLELQDTSIDLDFYEKERKIFIIEKTPQDIIDVSYLKELFTSQGLSVTALNNYLKSPWTYFFRNLIRLPEAKTDGSLLYGTAIHNTFQQFFESRKRGEDVGLDFLLSTFDNDWNRVEILEETDKRRYLKRGLESLTVWYENYHESLPFEVLSEVNVNIQLTEEIKLTGKIDKIELLGGGDVVVVDYKTGKAKTRNEITGETKNSEGDYYRQLVFYKLLLRYYKEGMYQMQKGELDFVEPDAKGKMHKESFVITDEEVDDLENLIKQVSQEIISGEFLNRPCDPAKCDYCDLVQYLKTRKNLDALDKNMV